MKSFPLFPGSGLRLRRRCVHQAMVLLGLVLLTPASAAWARVDEGLAAVQRAALVHAGLSPQTSRHLLARQHLAALLPQLRVTLGRGWQLSATGRALDGLTAPEVDGDHISYAVSASWDLARLLVPHEAMQHHHEEPRRAQLRLALLSRVTQLVAARCRLLQHATGAESAQHEQAAELEAALDLLTGGHALPEVTANTTCPAAPRFELELSRGVPAGRHLSPSRRSSGRGAAEGSGGSTESRDNGDSGDSGDDAALGEAGVGAGAGYDGR